MAFARSVVYSRYTNTRHSFSVDVEEERVEVLATTLPSSLRGILRKQESDNISLMDELNQTMKQEEDEEKASKAEKPDKDEKQHSTTLIIRAKNWSSGAIQAKRMYPPGSKGHRKKVII